MTTSMRRFPVAVIAVFFAACGAPADSPPTGSGTDAARPAAEPPTAQALLALDRQATEAYFKGDAASLAGLLSDPFVMLGPGGARMDRAATLRMVAGVSCNVKDGWTLDEPRLSAVDAHTYVLSYKSTVDGTCTVDGRAEKAPSPVRAATVWVRSGDSWRAAFHGENPIFDPSSTAAPPDAPAARADAPSQGGAAARDARAAAPAADAVTDALVAIETSVWEAWGRRDASVLEALTAADLAFVDIFGNVTSGRVETIRFWTEHQCNVTGTRVADATGTPLSATVRLLTFTGLLEGTCGGQKFPVIYGTSVYTRDGDAWKLAFTLNDLTT